MHTITMLLTSEIRRARIQRVRETLSFAFVDRWIVYNGNWYTWKPIVIVIRLFSSPWPDAFSRAKSSESVFMLMSDSRESVVGLSSISSATAQFISEAPKPVQITDSTEDKDQQRVVIKWTISIKKLFMYTNERGYSYGNVEFPSLAVSSRIFYVICYGRRFRSRVR